MLPGADDAIRFRDCSRAEGKCRNGLRSAHLETRSRLQASTPFPRTFGRVNSGHGHRNSFLPPATCAGITVIMTVDGKGVPPAGNVGGDRVEAARTIWPSRKPGFIIRISVTGICIAANSRMFADATSTAFSEFRGKRRGGPWQARLAERERSFARVRRSAAHILVARGLRVLRTSSRIGRTTSSASPSRAARRANKRPNLFRFKNTNHCFTSLSYSADTPQCPALRPSSAGE